MSKYSEEDLVRELSRSWLSKSDRKWMERELAKIRAAGSPQRPQQSERPAEARAGAEGQIFIDGSPEFVAATEKALTLLQGTPSWVLAARLRGIKQVSSADIGNSEVGGYLSDGVFHCGDEFWRNSAVHYASGIAHEGAHAARPDVIGTEGERMAFKAQAQALRELGAPAHLVNKYERDAANPTHHLNWKGPARRAA